MSIALDEDRLALADSVAQLCRRHASIEGTRQSLTALGAGEAGPAWAAIVAQGLHAVHLPEHLGGAGAGLMELAVVAEELGRRLAPGPWLPTVMASALITDEDLLRELVDGATGAVVLEGITAEQTAGGWRVTGRSEPTLGLPGADVVLVRAAAGAGPVWFRLPPGEGRVVPADGVDLTRSVGRIEVDLRVDEVLTAPDDVELVRAALLSAEAAGIAAWALERAVEHLTTREQFGRPLGAFQALQHRAASMLLRKEAAVAASWDAARSAALPAVQREVAAAQAIVTSLPAAVDNVFDLISVLGALGITWEHDAHLYWRRAISNAAAPGDTATWARRLGETALGVSRATGFEDPSLLPDLRARVAPVLDQVQSLPAEEAHEGAWGRWTGGERQRLLADAGLMAPHLPPPYGLGAGPEEQAVIADELARRDIPQPTLIVGDWFLPTLMAHGTEQQQERFAGPSLRGDVIWCQLFSEPGAGSDLASLRTKAVRVDGGWRVTGQKVWNSRACEAHWGVCLARTDDTGRKHEGLTYFLVDMAAPGVDARPIKQANGASELAEVFLDDVLVPDDCVIGQPGEGWRVAVGTLSNERLTMGSRLRYGDSATVARLLDDGAVRDDVLRVVGECTAREIALAALNLRTVLGRISGREMSAELSVNKVLAAVAQRDGSRALLSLLGPQGTTTEGGYVMDYLGMPAVLFGGGTIEVQLNVIAQRVLGLPRG
jgi:alkylation response protein AidB-like acyl-CoA dehydrogenase